MQFNVIQPNTVPQIIPSASQGEDDEMFDET
jgi:hypothetical protein